MIVNPVFQITITLLTAILSYTFIVNYISKEKKSDSLKKTIWLLLTCFIWSSGEVIIILSDYFNLNLGEYIEIVTRYTFLGSYFWGPIWLVFCSSYLNDTPFKFLDKKSSLAKSLFYILLFLPQVILYAIFFTNNYLHHWISTWISPGKFEFGFAYWMNIATSAVYLLAGTILLGKNLKRIYGFSKQTVYIIISAVVPSIISTLYFALDFCSYFYCFDIAPPMFLLSFILLTIATYKYNYLSLLPLAFPKIIDNLKDTIIIIDKNNIITNINKSFAGMFPLFPNLKDGNHISNFTGILKSKSVPDPKTERLIKFIENADTEGHKGELCLYDEDKYISVDIQPLLDKNKRVGRVVTLSDISYYRKIHKNLEEKNSQLEDMNKQLKDYAETAEELAVTKERNRFARDIHDSTGHTMSVLISILGVCTVLCKDNQAAKDKLDEALSITKEGLGELRRSIYGLYSKNIGTYNMINALKKLTEEFENTGVKVDLNIEGNYIEYGIKYDDIIYKICQEALTNSLKHGKATNVNIFIEFTRLMIKIFIIDNGNGCMEVHKGMGLISMEERVGNANGNIAYGSDGEQGFHIHIDIPLLYHPAI